MRLTSAFRVLPRVLLAYVFISSGTKTLRDPSGPVRIAGPTLERFRPFVPNIEPTAVVMVNASLHVVAGLLLATGRVPRLAATFLAASLVPTTAVGHAFWTLEDPKARAQQRIHFAKNAAIVGGLLAVALPERTRS
jgi:putative oxidoreductase